MHNEPNREHPLQLFRFCPKCGSQRFVVHDEKSKHCEACGFTFYTNPYAATVALILRGGKELLVVRRAKEPAKGTLDLPGGFSDLYETSEEGVRREVREETGLHVTTTRYLFSLPNRYLYSGWLEHTMDMFFLCEVEETETAHAMDDAAELLWIPLQDLRPADFGLDSVRLGIEKFLGNFPI
ncbi:MAG: NUDIX domain-containing protein [Bacteroidaceae bacterium]|nr:NUDIX domain-containing protein [Bacteroidaceae bacterium]